MPLERPHLFGSGTRIRTKQVWLLIKRNHTTTVNILLQLTALLCALTHHPHSHIIRTHTPVHIHTTVHIHTPSALTHHLLSHTSSALTHHRRSQTPSSQKSTKQRRPLPCPTGCPSPPAPPPLCVPLTPTARQDHCTLPNNEKELGSVQPYTKKKKEEKTGKEKTNTIQREMSLCMWPYPNSN